MFTCPYCGRPIIQKYRGSCGPQCSGPTPNVKPSLTSDQITDLIRVVERRMRDSDISAFTYDTLYSTLQVLKEMKKCST